MNFGDILAQYDKIKKEEKNKSKIQQKSHKKANAPDKNEKEAMAQGYSYEQLMEEQNKRSINPMELWLNRYGTVDKDKELESYQEKKKWQNREYLKNLKPEARLDLHGLTREQAWLQMESFVNDCVRRGLHKIMFVHGKGIHSNGSDPVLGEAVRIFVEQDKRLGAFGHPDRTQGGNGATWVLIKA